MNSSDTHSDSNLQQQVNQLQRRLQRQTRALYLLSCVLGGLFIAGVTPKKPDYLRVRGVTVVDNRGRTRVLIGAPPETLGRKRQDAATASIVVVDPDGTDRVVLGDIPNPVMHGKVYPRAAASYGLTIHDKMGQERGAMVFLDNGRGVIALDRLNQDAVEMVVNDQTGFAGLTMNYEQPFGKYKEAVRMGTKGDEVWWTLSDTSSSERASLRVKGNNAPSLDLHAAKKR